MSEIPMHWCPACGGHHTALYALCKAKKRGAGPALDQTLAERGSRYGVFTGHAEVAQGLKAVAAEALRARGKTLAPDQREALDMIFHKIGRIVNGDPDYDDSWVDTAGYAKLVADRLQGLSR